MDKNFKKNRNNKNIKSPEDKRQYWDTRLVIMNSEDKEKLSLTIIEIYKIRRCPMNTEYFTITGLDYRYGSEFLENGMTVNLVKEPDNEYDKEAIKVVLPGLGTIGYVANSTRTVLGDSHSAGYLYHMIDEGVTGTVLYKLPGGVICSLNNVYDEDAEYKVAARGIGDDRPFDI